MAKLKVRLLNLLAGRPVAILHKDYADRATIHPGERVCIEKGDKITSIVDTARGFLDEGEIVVSNEVAEELNLKEGQEVEVRLAHKPESIDLIYKKLKGERLNKKELTKIMRDITENNLTEAEISYYVAGILKEGMTSKETADMTKAMVETGDKLDLDDEVVEKHSIGGIPGRTSPIVVAICSAIGLKMPKTSSRAITTPAGTADAMETVCKVDFSLQEIKNLLKKNNALLVWGGSLNLAPADDKIIRAEKLLSLDPTPQLLASVLSKHLAVNANHLLIHIPYGKHTKVTEKEASKLRREFKKISKHFDLEVECLLRKTKEPYGNGVGPALEMKDAIDVLKGKPCHNLRERSLQIAGKILEMGGRASKGKGKEKAREILDSGEALKAFKRIVKIQGGKIKNLDIGEAKYKKQIKARKGGEVKEVLIKKINSLARIAGCPLDKKAGLYLYKHLNDKVNKGEKLLTIYSESKSELNQALDYYKKEEPMKIK